MRLRGYDESTEELSDDLKNITGDIADLTKTASNGGKGISLFTDESRQTYKSTYEIIKEIAKIWNELSDKNQAELLEKLAGKRNSQVVAAAIQNFSTAEKAMTEMANSQGNAMAEMEIAYESINYKVNQFRETLVGIAQSSFSQDFLKSIVDSGTRVLNVFDDLSPSISFILEQFATLLEFVTKLADTIGGIPLLIAGIGLKNVGNIKTWLYELKEVQMAINGISTLSTWANGGTNQFADSSVVIQYANQLRGLSAQQVELALSTKLLTAEQKQQIMVELGLVASEDKIQSELLQTTLAQSGLSAEKQKAILLELELINATTLEPIARKACTKAQLEEQLALHGVTGAQAEQIMSTLGMSTANATATVSFELLTKSIWANIKAIGVWLISNPVGWAILATTAIAGVVTIVDELNVSLEEQKEISEDLQQEYSDTTNELSNLETELSNIKSRIDELNSQEHLSFVEKEELDNLEQSNFQLERRIALLKEKQELESQKTKESIQKEYQKDFETYDGTAATQITMTKDRSVSENVDLYKNLKDIYEKYQSGILSDEDKDYINQLSFDYQIDFDNQDEMETLLENNKQSLVEYANEISDYITRLEDAGVSENDAFLQKLQSDFEVIDRILNPAIYKTYDFENIVNSDTFKTQTDEITKMAKDGSLSVETLTNKFPELAKALSDSGFSAEEAVSQFYALNDELKNNSDNFDNTTKSLEELQEVYDNLAKSASDYTKNQKSITSALEEQEKYGQISASTIQDLTDAGYARALSIDAETGAVTLNKSAVERLNEQKREQLKLDLAEERTELSQKFKDEQKAINDLAEEMKSANNERREAIRLEMIQHGQTMSDYAELMAQIDGSISSLDAPEFDNSKSSTKDEEPKSVTQFKKALAEKEHLLNTNQISEQEYYEWLDSESKRVYGNLADYEEDLWKYEEQVYKWRQEQEQDLFDKKIENYKKLSDNALDKYVDGNGKELTVNASFDYARSQINSAITETQNRINELSLKKGFEDEIDELTSDLEGLYDTLDDINKQEIESQKEYIETLKNEYSDLMDEQIDQQKKLAEEIEKSYENRISAIDKQIDALKKVSEAEERQKSILEAEKDVKEAMLELDKAKTKKRLVYSGDGSWHLKEDKSAVDEAKKNLEDKQQSLEEAKQDEQIAKLEEQKELLETQKEDSKNYYDAVITDLENQKTARKNQYDILVDIYEQLGGEKKQTSLNESLVEKLTSNGDINKVVEGLTPTELQQAITSGVLTTDSNGNYAIDYSILQNNEQAVKDNTSELEKLNNQLSGKSDTVNSNAPTYNNKNLDAEGYLIGADGKRVLHDGKPIKALSKSEWEKRHTTDEWSPKGKDVEKMTMEEYYKKLQNEKSDNTNTSKKSFAGYDTMKGFLNAIMTGEYTIPTSTANSMMNSNINSRIGRDITKVPEYVNNVVNNNNAPVINQTITIEGSADKKTIAEFKTVMDDKFVEYTQYMTQSMDTAFMRQINKS